MTEGQLEICVEMAERLKDVRKIGNMHAYVVAWVQKPGATFSADQNAAKVMTTPDKKGGSNPEWHEILRLRTTADLAELRKSFLIFHIYTSSLIMPDDTLVGSSVIPLDNLLPTELDASVIDDAPISTPLQRATVPVQRPSLRYKGTLTFSLRLVYFSLGGKRSANTSRLPDSLLNKFSEPSVASFGDDNVGGGGSGPGAAAAAVASMMLF
ncbi:hypothetical protein KP509_32G039500 [Ceratopteris richardii]|uniref:C2 domain-containing protein n=1 Tax=Ceratopteris richardii TaxID=49495 RepID=A0A8T2QT00_CERRI|nr:hypothetical protein KP509_32G039500 [Ceratopteris richardii]